MTIMNRQPIRVVDVVQSIQRQCCVTQYKFYTYQIENCKYPTNFVFTCHKNLICFSVFLHTYFLFPHQDTVIYERLEGSHPYSDITLQHLEQFATTGLRTLCIAVSVINDEFYEEWKHTYYKASTSLQNRDRKQEEAAELIERVNNIEH